MTPPSDLTGRLVAASPHLHEGFFFRTVIFMVRHDDEGAFGLVINRPTDRRFRDHETTPPGPAPVRDDDFIFRGGPVGGPMLALHDVAGIGDPVGDGEASTIQWQDNPAEPHGSMNIDLSPSPFWITADSDQIALLVRRPDAGVRLFIQYAGWGPGQLENECRGGGWLDCEAEPSVVFGDPDDVWQTVVERCGVDVLRSIDPNLKPGDGGRN